MKSKHIKEFINNSKKIRDILEERKGTPYKELNSGILYGLLAHSHSWKGYNSRPIANIKSALRVNELAVIDHPVQLPDIICVADLATWSCAKFTIIGPDQIPDWSEGFSKFYGPNGCATSGYLCYSEESENQSENFSPIGAMLTFLLTKLSWEYPNLRSLSNYFLATDLHGSGIGEMRKWESSIYTDETWDRIKNNELSKGRAWDDWVLIFE